MPCLTEIRGYTVELTPSDRHPIRIRRVNAQRGLVSGVADDVVAVGIYVNLVRGVRPERHDHARGKFKSPGNYRGGRVLNMFEVRFAERLSRQRLGQNHRRAQKQGADGNRERDSGNNVYPGVIILCR